ncbi:MAG: phosphatase PAP2 family protein [Chlorobi bacterium]|nr:phosphatase PAP2 family protein [Chlorobiota bacterium]
MLSFLLWVDQLLFTTINQGASNVVFDAVMPIVTKLQWWLPVFVLGIGWLVVRGGKTGRQCALLVLAAVAVADPITNRLIKPLVARERPCRQLPQVILRIPCADGPSFPSSHAVNMAAVATVVSAFYRRGRWLWWFAALLVGFSRIYVGVHFPFDVISGWIGGIVFGMLTVKAIQKSAALLQKRRLRWW